MASFPLSYSPRLRWVFLLLGMGPGRSAVTVDDAAVEVRMVGASTLASPGRPSGRSRPTTAG